MVAAFELLGTVDHTFTRYSAGSNVGGRLQIPASEDLTLAVRFQSKSDGLEQYQQYSQEHRCKLDGALIVKSGEPLQAMSSDGLTPADRFNYRGRRYMVVKSEDNRDTVLPHCYAEALQTLSPDPVVTAP